MLNWFMINDVKKPDIIENNSGNEDNMSIGVIEEIPPSISTTPTTLETLETLETDQEHVSLTKELLKDIHEFDHVDLFPMNWYLEQIEGKYSKLLDSIRKFNKDSLKHVEPKISCNFLTKLQYTLEVIVVDNRIKNYGMDTGYSYSDEEYKNAFKKLVSVQFHNKYKNILKMSFGIFVLSGIGILIEHNQFLSGVYFTNLLLYSSVILRNFLG